MHKVLSRMDVAKLLRVTYQTVINYEKRGLLKPVYILGRIRFHEADIMALLPDSLKIETASE